MIYYAWVPSYNFAVHFRKRDCWLKYNISILVVLKNSLSKTSTLLYIRPEIPSYPTFSHYNIQNKKNLYLQKPNSRVKENGSFWKLRFITYCHLVRNNIQGKIYTLFVKYLATEKLKKKKYPEVVFYPFKNNCSF